MFDKNKVKVQCEVIVDFTKLGKKFMCVQRLTIAEIEDILNSKTIGVKCIDTEFVKNTIEKMSTVYSYSISNVLKEYTATIYLYFDKYIIVMEESIYTGIVNKNTSVCMQYDNLIIRENEFITKQNLLIKGKVKCEPLELRGYVRPVPTGVIYEISPNKK